MVYHGTPQHLHAPASMVLSWSEIHVEAVHQLSYQALPRFLIVEIVSTPKDSPF